MSRFKVGDVVRLKSGGPDITIAEVGDGDLSATWCECWYVNGAGAIERLYGIDFACLVKSEDHERERFGLAQRGER